MPIAGLIVNILSALGNARNPDDYRVQSNNQLASSITSLLGSVGSRNSNPAYFKENPSMSNYVNRNIYSRAHF